MIRKTFIYFLLDTVTGRAYYRNAGGTISTLVITAGVTDVTLKDDPATWLDTELGFGRNLSYFGLFRGFTVPQEFVRSVKLMIDELFLLGVGTETPLSIAIFKKNVLPASGEPSYKLYAKSPLDLSQIESTALESTKVNLLDGGVAQLLKSYENTVVEIPCDGSIPENFKVNFDGLKLPDTLYYNVTPIKGFNGVAHILGASFINNEGDNFGVIKNSTFDEIVPGSLIDSSNYIVSFSKKTKVRVKGDITVTNNNDGEEVQFRLYWRKQAPIVFPDELVPFTLITSQTRFTYDFEVELQPYEKLFLVYQMTSVSSTDNNEIVSGGFSVSFNSQYPSTRAWAVNSYDLFKLIVKEICRIASTPTNTVSYPAESQLLQNYLNFALLSGDSLKASGDPNYKKYYYVNNNNQTSFGPVIKTTIKEFYESISAQLCAAMGNGFNGTSETVFFETLRTVFNNSAISFSLGEVSKLKWKFSNNFSLSDFHIGYDPQQYDQRAGKYEYNTLLQMKAPIKGFSKEVKKISKYRWDSYGIERVRANINTGAQTSTTRNDSDNSVFGANIDLESFIYDYFNANFTSLVPDPDSAGTTNIMFQRNVTGQQVNLPITDGDYFQPNTDMGIFVFSKVGYSASESCNVNIQGVINAVNRPSSAPADSITIKLWHNGNIVYQQTVTVTAVNTVVNINHSFTRSLQYKDCMYITAETTPYCEANINTADLTIGSYVSMSGVNIPVLPGTPQKVLSLPTVIPTSKPYDTSSVVNYGYQYFVFNSNIPNSTFKIELGVQGYLENQVADFEIEIYINGVRQVEKITVPGSVSRINFFQSLPSSITRSFSLNDIVFITASVYGSSLDVQLNSANIVFTSNYIKAYNLKRVNYDSLTGIPNVVTDDTGELRTDLPGCPYNIEQVTPKSLYKNWLDFIKSNFLDQVTGKMLFRSLSKNPYLSRTIGGVTITENTDEDILSANRMFYPIEVEVETAVPIGFADLLTNSKNAHIHFTFMGRDFYFFPLELKQKPALNEMQTWRGLLSPSTSLANLVNITSFKMPEMGPNSIYCSSSSTVQFVPVNRTLDDKYHTYNRNGFLFQEQINNWLNKTDYTQPVQIGDPITLQFITRDLNPVEYTVYKLDGSIYEGPQNLDSVTSNAVNSPFLLWQYSIDTTSWGRGDYFIVVTAGVGGIAAQLLSEPIQVLTKEELDGTVLAKVQNSFNTQGLIFDGSTPFIGYMRFYGGYDNRFRQKYIGRFNVDQGQNINMLNAVPYETTTLFIGRNSGIPDYVAKKILRFLLMDSLELDGEGFSINEGAELEEVFYQGAPLKIQKVEIRPTKNKDGIVVDAGGIDDDFSMVVSVNAEAFGPNINNESGTTTSNLIEINVEQ